MSEILQPRDSQDASVQSHGNSAQRSLALFSAVAIVVVVVVVVVINHVIGDRLPAQPISIRKAQSRKKSPQTFAHLMNFSNNVSAMFDNHTILLF